MSAALLGFAWTSCSSKPDADGSTDSTSLGGGAGGGPGGALGGGGLGMPDGGTGGGATGGGGIGGSNPIATGGNLNGGSSSGGTGGGSSCNTEPLDPPTQAAAPRVDLENQPPVPAGGMVVDGIYDQIDYVFYEEVNLSVLVPSRQAMRFSSGGKTVDIARQSATGGRLDVTLKVDTEGTRLALTVVCPEGLAGAVEESRYTAVGEDLWVFLEQLGSTAVIHYAQR